MTKSVHFFFNDVEMHTHSDNQRRNSLSLLSLSHAQQYHIDDEFHAKQSSVSLCLSVSLYLCCCLSHTQQYHIDDKLHAGTSASSSEKEVLLA
jgi:hypothetical protein